MIPWGRKDTIIIVVFVIVYLYMIRIPWGAGQNQTIFSWWRYFSKDCENPNWRFRGFNSKKVDPSKGVDMSEHGSQLNNPNQ